MSPAPGQVFDVRVPDAVADHDLSSVYLNGPMAAVSVAEMNIQGTELTEVARAPYPRRRDVHEGAQQDADA